MFFRKKAYLITWKRNLCGKEEILKTVVIDKDESYAVSKFLRHHNAKIEKVEILIVEECGYII